MPSTPTVGDAISLDERLMLSIVHIIRHQVSLNSDPIPYKYTPHPNHGDAHNSTWVEVNTLAAVVASLRETDSRTIVLAAVAAVADTVPPAQRTKILDWLDSRPALPGEQRFPANDQYLTVYTDAEATTLTRLRGRYDSTVPGGINTTIAPPADADTKARKAAEKVLRAQFRKGKDMAPAAKSMYVTSDLLVWSGGASDDFTEYLDTPLDDEARAAWKTLRKHYGDEFSVTASTITSESA